MSQQDLQEVVRHAEGHQADEEMDDGTDSFPVMFLQALKEHPFLVMFATFGLVLTIFFGMVGPVLNLFG